MRKKTILIVEDEPIIGADLHDRLSDLGYQVLGVVDTGEEALSRVRSQVPDLILLDVTLAGKLDGVETSLRTQPGKTQPRPLKTGFLSK